MTDAKHAVNFNIIRGSAGGSDGLLWAVRPHPHVRAAPFHSIATPFPRCRD